MNPVQSTSNFWVQLKQAAVIVNGGIVLFAGINIYRGTDKFYDEIAMPMFRILGPETAHSLGIKLAKYKLVPRPQLADPPSLESKLWGKSFPNPIGLAAGYDKQGEAVDGLLKLGFGFVEVGSVTPEPQPGNPAPRVFRLVEDRAIINRYGFNSDGHEVVYQRLSKRGNVDTGYPSTYIGEQRNMLNINLWTETEDEDKSRSSWPKVINRRRIKEKGVVGVNLGKNKTSTDPIGDYVKGVQKFGSLADYLVINVSSPNTPGLRDMQRQEELSKLIDKVVEERNNLPVISKPPILVKIAPDLSESEKKDIAAVVTRPKCGVDGLIISNTTVSRPESLESKNKSETGGLSGPPLKDLSLQVIRDMYGLTKGQLPIVGVGGVSSGEDAYAKVRAGASLIQLYTAMVYHGPPVVTKIKREMDELLKRDGFNSISEAVGADFKVSQQQKQK